MLHWRNFRKRWILFSVKSSKRMGVSNPFLSKLELLLSGFWCRPLSKKKAKSIIISSLFVSFHLWTLECFFRWGFFSRNCYKYLFVSLLINSANSAVINNLKILRIFNFDVEARLPNKRKTTPLCLCICACPVLIISFYLFIRKVVFFTFRRKRATYVLR